MLRRSAQLAVPANASGTPALPRHRPPDLVQPTQKLPTDQAHRHLPSLSTSAPRSAAVVARRTTRHHVLSAAITGLGSARARGPDFPVRRVAAAGPTTSVPFENRSRFSGPSTLRRRPPTVLSASPSSPAHRDAPGGVLLGPPSVPGRPGQLRSICARSCRSRSVSRPPDPLPRRTRARSQRIQAPACLRQRNRQAEAGRIEPAPIRCQPQRSSPDPGSLHGQQLLVASDTPSTRMDKVISVARHHWATAGRLVDLVSSRARASPLPDCSGSQACWAEPRPPSCPVLGSLPSPGAVFPPWGPPPSPGANPLPGGHPPNPPGLRDAWCHCRRPPLSCGRRDRQNRLPACRSRSTHRLYASASRH